MNIFNLIAKLTLDKSDYDTKIKEAQKENTEFAKSTEQEVGEKVPASWAKILGKITAVVAAIGLVIKTMAKLVNQSAAYADNIKNMAQIYGITVQQAQELNSVAEQSGKNLEYVLRKAKDGQKSFNEVLGLSTEEYKAMVEQAYELGTIATEESINAVDNLGDSIAYLKSQWVAVITALLAGEEGAEEKVQKFFDRILAIANTYLPTITAFGVKLLVNLALGMIKIAPTMVAEVVTTVIETLFSINWFKVGVDVGKAILAGVINILGSIISLIPGVDIPKVDFGTSDASSYIPETISTNKTKIETESTLNVNIAATGDTAISAENAKQIADIIDKYLGGK